MSMRYSSPVDTEIKQALYYLWCWVHEHLSRQDGHDFLCADLASKKHKSTALLRLAAGDIEVKIKDEL